MYCLGLISEHIIKSKAKKVSESFFNYDIYSKLSEHLMTSSYVLRINWLKLLNTIEFENQKQIQTLIDANIIKALIGVINESDENSKIYAIRALILMIKVSGEVQLSYRYLKGVVKCLCQSLINNLSDKEKIDIYECIVINFLQAFYIKSNEHKNQILGDIRKLNVFDTLRNFMNNYTYIQSICSLVNAFLKINAWILFTINIIINYLIIVRINHFSHCKLNNLQCHLNLFNMLILLL